jgi:hypothetical protein
MYGTIWLPYLGLAQWVENQFLTQMVHQHFSPPMTNAPLGELKLLGHERSMEDYNNHFMSLSCQNPELMQSQLIELYTASLENPLKTDAEARYPKVRHHVCTRV